MRKKFKKKKTINIKFIIIILLIIYSIKYINFNNVKDLLINNSIKEIKKEDSIITNNLDIDLTNPKKLIYLTFNKLVNKEDTLKVYEEYFDYDKALTDYSEDTTNINVDNPIVYIYNSHQLEEYNIKVLYDYSVKPNVLIASYILKEKLYDKGIPSVVETNNIKKYLNDNKLKYKYSYKASRHFIDIKLKEYPSIKYLIDIHRDSAGYNKTLYTKDNKNYARIMFVVGLDHKNYKSNLSLANKLNDMVESLYPGLSRGISKKTGKGVNGIYNQDVSPNSMLIEVGGVDNTIEEVNNTIEVISLVLSNYIKDDDYGE